MFINHICLSLLMKKKNRFCAITADVSTVEKLLIMKSAMKIVHKTVSFDQKVFVPKKIAVYCIF